MAFVTNADHKTTHINNVRSKSTLLLIVSIVVRKDILQEIAQQMKKVYTKKVALALAVDQ